MSNKYDDYGYEDSDSERNSVTRKRILIGIFIIAAIIIIIFLLKGCNGNKKPVEEKPVFDYENNLLDAGKKFYENNIDLYPVAKGECGQVELQTLIDRGLVDPANYSNCNTNTTFVKVCVLESGTKQYTPWLVCTDKDSDKEYDEYKEGTIADVTPNKTLVKFLFMPQKLKNEGSNLGKVEEVWKDEIKYTSYKTIATTKYYRYKDLTYIWNIEFKKYYSSKGETDSTNEYYVSSPASGYTSKDSKTNDAYKWFTTKSKKIYACSKDKNKTFFDCTEAEVNSGKYGLGFSTKAIAGYQYNEGGVTTTRYRSRKVTGTYQPTLYYQCAVSRNSTYAKNQKVPCGEGSDPELTYQIKTFYSCVTDNSTSVLDNIVEKGTLCKTYSDWSAVTTQSCGKASDVCQIASITQYNWYRLESDGNREYYPSKSSTAAGEKVYYTSAPVKGAIKDESTKATAYKWYKATSGQTKDYSAVAPAGQTNATKTNQSKWTDWSSWSTKNPKISDGRTRNIETRVKVKLQEIKGDLSESSWENLAPDYVTEDEMIRIFNDNKFDITTLKDIDNYGEIRYQIKMYVRNKKEVSK